MQFSDKVMANLGDTILGPPATRPYICIYQYRFY